MTIVWTDIQTAIVIIRTITVKQNFIIVRQLFQAKIINSAVLTIQALL